MPENPAYAKINLGLRVLGRREDGYHDVETVLVRIGWADIIRVERRESPGIRFSCSDIDLPTDESNTCVKAAKLLATRFAVDAGADIYLDKMVPYGAGLGSGSSDAATVLVMLSELWGLRCPAGELEALAAEIGSDVSFFIDGRPALATGRGTDLERMSCGSERPYELARTVAVAVPPVRIATSSAYASIEIRSGERAHLRSLVCSNNPERWRQELVNDFQAPMCQRHPVLADIIDHFRKAGAAYVSLSGSGSAVYALFDAESDARAALVGEPMAGCTTWYGATV